MSALIAPGLDYTLKLFVTWPLTCMDMITVTCLVPVPQIVWHPSPDSPWCVRDTHSLWILEPFIHLVG